MNRHTRILMLGVAFMIVLSFAVNSVSAAPSPSPKWQPWHLGIQVPTNEPTLVRFGRNSVVLEGAEMFCYFGYTFGTKTVVREVIDWMIVFASLEDLGQHPELGYTARRVGRFTWYDGGGNVVARGTFVYSSKKQMGYLWAQGPGLIVKGTFWVRWEQVGGVPVPFVDHTGEYLLTG